MACAVISLGLRGLGGPQNITSRMVRITRLSSPSPYVRYARHLTTYDCFTNATDRIARVVGHLRINHASFPMRVSSNVRPPRTTSRYSNSTCTTRRPKREDLPSLANGSYPPLCSRTRAWTNTREASPSTCTRWSWTSRPWSSRTPSRTCIVATWLVCRCGSGRCTRSRRTLRSVQKCGERAHIYI